MSIFNIKRQHLNLKINRTYTISTGTGQRTRNERNDNFVAQILIHIAFVDGIVYGRMIVFVAVFFTRAVCSRHWGNIQINKLWCCELSVHKLMYFIVRFWRPNDDFISMMLVLFLFFVENKKKKTSYAMWLNTYQHDYRRWCCRCFCQFNDGRTFQRALDCVCFHEITTAKMNCVLVFIPCFHHQRLMQFAAWLSSALFTSVATRCNNSYPSNGERAGEWEREWERRRQSNDSLNACIALMMSICFDTLHSHVLTTESSTRSLWLYPNECQNKCIDFPVANKNEQQRQNVHEEMISVRCRDKTIRM